jgi:aspartyl-tRNA(Asn)/glutamyl-tRNA(Gln) amidotransferase subunit B|tara:strand:+ start:2851 stop:4335 length:1485 start_codon:yes stop_codon:yes gene_type:complete
MTDKYETVIGLEVHSQLLTLSKMFCPCGSDYQDSEPNTRVCPVCMGMPGVLPVVNKKAVNLVIKTGLALECEISPETKFDRKNYPYPDLMKGYQISQFDIPIALGGRLSIKTPETGGKYIRITRVHLEEDVAKLVHRKEPNGETYSLLDINRAGVPLMEIVSEPDMNSPEEANEYLTNLHSIIRFVETSTANMEEGSFRCDANISVRPLGSKKLGSKVEIKNVNSFRSVFRALKYEETRQRKLLDAGHNIEQETRGWSDDRGTTLSQRTKEYAADYRYFPEPDLPPILISNEWVKSIQSEMPELPAKKKERYIDLFGLSDYDASVMIGDKESTQLFENTLPYLSESMDQKDAAKATANWINVDLNRMKNELKYNWPEIKLNPKEFAKLIILVDDGKISNSMAKTVFDDMFVNGGDPIKISEDKGLSQINDASSIQNVVTETLLENQSAVDDYLNGKDSAVRYLVGQVMKKTKGQANPQVASKMVTSALIKQKTQ